MAHLCTLQGRCDDTATGASVDHLQAPNEGFQVEAISRQVGKAMQAGVTMVVLPTVYWAAASADAYAASHAELQKHTNIRGGDNAVDGKVQPSHVLVLAKLVVTS